MKIVTGHRNEAHVTSGDMQALNQNLFWSPYLVLDTGSKFNATSDDFTVTVQSGDGVMHGVQFRAETSESKTITRPSSSGKYRGDLIVARYTKNETTGIEDVQLVVKEGTESASQSPTFPTATSGDPLAGAVLDEMPLWKVLVSYQGVQALESVREFHSPSRPVQFVPFDAAASSSYSTETWQIHGTNSIVPLPEGDVNISMFGFVEFNYKVGGTNVPSEGFEVLTVGFELQDGSDTMSTSEVSNVIYGHTTPDRTDGDWGKQPFMINTTKAILNTTGIYPLVRANFSNDTDIMYWARFRGVIVFY